jgi:hypothetical protein
MIYDLNKINVVSDSQSDFVKGKQILDGVLIANEAVDEARRLNKEMILFKVDFEKAYDSLSGRCYVKNEFSYPLEKVDF